MNSHPVWGVSKGQKEKIGHDHIGKEFCMKERKNNV